MTPDIEKLLARRYQVIHEKSYKQKQPVNITYDEFIDFLKSNNLLDRFVRGHQGFQFRQIDPTEPYARDNIEMVSKTVPRRPDADRFGYVQLSVKEWVESLRRDQTA